MKYKLTSVTELLTGEGFQDVCPYKLEVFAPVNTPLTRWELRTGREGKVISHLSNWIGTWMPSNRVYDKKNESNMVTALRTNSHKCDHVVWCICIFYGPAEGHARCIYVSLPRKTNIFATVVKPSFIHLTVKVFTCPWCQFDNLKLNIWERQFGVKEPAEDEEAGQDSRANQECTFFPHWAHVSFQWRYVLFMQKQQQQSVEIHSRILMSLEEVHVHL